ncbi:AfsR/SARP family transcriptional regulator [Micromonospora peucetia]|uniref:DNA-binding transcriptional activator of the SARP family n=1 Tax=Micromonospora peucetia TaxID=47871 RepID=A0A1C6W4E8_9ACTN|nr:BTAD domain-containing putative transcriptional regulator [Micromonospora peucetia]WSA32573.1 NB-ARC domain-containing protein [Micromonospora peucetia]SCL73439.1 DNA-binding transcriptional activator of the SARP family [Micromonospora peucetia]
MSQASIKFRILGPVEYHDGENWVPIKAAKQRTLMALLLLNANHLVSAQQLHSELWNDGPSSHVGSLLAGCVWRLRAAIGDSAGETLLTRPAGYQLAVPSGGLDLHEYESLVASGRMQRASGNLVEAMRSFSAALELWRGSPLADVALTSSIMAESARLEESRLAVLEANFGMRIALGQHEDVLPELKLLVAQHPLRERLHEHLMMALYRTGQQAEALGAYRDLHHLLSDELGIVPSRPLRELQQRILEEDPRLNDHGALPVATASGPGEPAVSPEAAPCLLPHQPSLFVGRTSELAAIVGLLAEGRPAVAIHGLAGSGKSALAIAAAHASAGDFPGGRVYVDMRGTTGSSALRPDQAMQLVLRSFGTEQGSGGAAVPHAWTGPAGGRALIVLDNVRDSDQIQEFLSVPPGCSLIVTSRSPIGGMDGLRHLRLGRLTVSASIDLLRQSVGTPRIDTEPAFASELARSCDYLPFALRLAADRLATRPDWSVADFARYVAEPHQRLDFLAGGNVSLRDSLLASLPLLSDESGGTAVTAVMALRRLGFLDLTIVTVEALAVLFGTREGEAHKIAERLVDVGLIESLAIDRYRVPQSVRALAREITGSDHEAAEAVQRVVDHYAIAAREQTRLTPGAWYRLERETLNALVTRDRTGALVESLGRMRSMLGANGSCSAHSES